jgi:Glycosyltransferase 61
VRVISSDRIPASVYKDKSLAAIEVLKLNLQFKEYLKNQLNNIEHTSLLELNNPTIIVYTFPSGENRHFILTANGTLLEKDNYWLQYFNFIKYNSNKYSIYIPANIPYVVNSVKDHCLWIPDSTNYSHFLIDSLAPALAYREYLNQYNNITIPSFAKRPIWQNEYMEDFFAFNKLEIQAPEHNQNRFYILKLEKLIVPIISNTFCRVMCMKNYIQKKYSSAFFYKNNNTRIPIYLTRNDARSARIRNSNEIKNLINKYNGIVVDPVNLTIRERVELFNRSAIFIAEGSGTMNAFIFGGKNSHLIALGDELASYNHSFLRGGAEYSYTFGSDLTVLMGTEPQLLPGSPLSSNLYNLELMDTIIKNKLII